MSILEKKNHWIRNIKWDPCNATKRRMYFIFKKTMCMIHQCALQCLCSLCERALLYTCCQTLWQCRRKVAKTLRAIDIHIGCATTKVSRAFVHSTEWRTISARESWQLVFLFCESTKVQNMLLLVTFPPTLPKIVSLFFFNWKCFSFFIVCVFFCYCRCSICKPVRTVQCGLWRKRKEMPF